MPRSVLRCCPFAILHCCLNKNSVVRFMQAVAACGRITLIWAERAVKGAELDGYKCYNHKL
jgi:hypothetical protein